MKKTLLFASLIVMLVSCGSKVTPDNGNGKKEDDGAKTDAEQFEAVILKKDVEKIADGSVLSQVENSPLCMTLTFSDGTSLLMGKHHGSFVGSDAEGFVTINGASQKFRVAGYPLYTLTDRGEWLSQGQSTGSSVIKTAPSGVSEAYVTFIENNIRRCLFHFSDGTTSEFPYTSETEMYVKKSASQMDVYIGSKGSSEFIQYPFKKRHSDFSPGVYKCYLDNWGIMALRLCSFNGGQFDAGTEIFLNGEAEMAVSVTDGSDPGKNNYVGGVLHGFENIVADKDGKRGFSITVDGVDVPENGTFELKKASKIVMTQSSDLCQAYTNTNPFAHAERVWTFENGRLTVKIELTLLRDMHFANGMFGMLCVLRRWKGLTSENYLTSIAVKDTSPLMATDVTDGWGSMGKDHSVRKITEYGERGWSFALCVDQADIKPNGGMFVGTNGNAYNKIYFDLTGAYDAKAGEVLSGQVHWEIERYY